MTCHPKKTLLVYKSGIKQHDTLQQQISLWPLVWLRATCCSGKILLRRQDFRKNSWNKQKVICPCNITYYCNMLLHLVTKCSNLLHITIEKWNVLNFSFDVVNKWSSQLRIVQDNKKTVFFFFLTKPDFEKTWVLKKWSKVYGKKTLSFEKKFFKSLSKNLSFYKGKNYRCENQNANLK